MAAEDKNYDEDEYRMFQPFKHQKELYSEAVKAKAQEKEVYIIQAASGGYSAGNFAKITINNKQVQPEKNSQGHHRGLHIVLIDQQDYRVVLAKVFDTYRSSTAFD